MIYLAASLKPQDIHVCEHMEKLCKGVKLDLYSPRSEGLLESMTEEERGDSSQVIFDTNIRRMDEAGLMLARVDVKDTGTLFEMGYFYGKEKPIIAFSHENPSTGMNVMLAKAVVGYFPTVISMTGFLFELSRYWTIEMNKILGTKVVYKSPTIDVKEAGHGFYQRAIVDTRVRQELELYLGNLEATE